MEEIKKTGTMSTKALLYMLERSTGAKLVNTDYTYYEDSFSNGQKYITVYCDFTLRGDVLDPDAPSLSRQIMDIDTQVFPLISQFVLDSKGKLKKVDSEDNFYGHDNSIFFNKCFYEFENGYKNLFMTYQYASNIYLDD